MTVLPNRRNWAKGTKATKAARAVGVVAVSIGVITAAGLSAAAPARADAMSDAFLSALSNAGVGYGDPNAAAQLGQSICPLLAQPGGNFAGVASSVANNGIPPGMASLFTNIAISMYCPQMMASLANGSWLNNGGGMPGNAGVPGIPGLPFQIPGLPGY
jgi:Protein of unknown function (DUF732)